MEAIGFKLCRQCDGLIGELPVVVCLGFGRRDIPDGFQQSMVVEPGYPFQRGELHGFLGLPGGSAMNEFGLVESIDRLCQGVDAPMSSGDGGVR